MPVELILQQTTEAAELRIRREELAAVRAALADRELDVADLRARLAAFEGLYMRRVGVLYAKLDDWEARIAEREVALYDSAEARERANEARRRAHETHEAAYGEAAATEPFEPSPDLKRLFREVAKRIHPDFARDAAEQHHFTHLMARANKAYGRGDGEALQRLLDDHHETSAALDGEDAAAELDRITRQIAHARRDLAALEEEIRVLPTSEIASFSREADSAEREGRDLLSELATSLREKIADAEYRYNFLDRQLFAHGK